MRTTLLRSLVLTPFVLALAACETTGSGNAAQSVGAALPDRPAADVARDAGRKPFEVLEFFGVQPGMTALDIIAAGGYYTEVLAHAVGPTGRVYAQNPATVLRFRGAANDRALTNRLAWNRLPNVRRLDREMDDLGLVAESIDVAITALNFHDLYNRDPEQAIGMLQGIKGVLKPGGVLGIIDHNANPGGDHAKLHRLPVADAIAAAEAAGYVVTQSDLLQNPQDDRTQSPFAPGLRGATDRFVLKLVKPAS